MVITSETTLEPRVRWSANEVDELVSVTITGLPVCSEDELENSAINQILHAYKRLLLSGVYGRTKTEHAQLLEKMRKEADEVYKCQTDEFLLTIPKEQRAKVARALKRRDEPAQGVFIRGMCKSEDDVLAGYNLPSKPQLFLPEDANFTLPVTYTVKSKYDPDTDTQMLMVEIFRSGANPAVKREKDGSLRVVSFSESFGWLAVYGQALAYDLKAFFEQAQRCAREHGTKPDYYNYHAD